MEESAKQVNPVELRSGHLEIIGETAAKLLLFQKGWNPYSIDNYVSAEEAFVKYIQRCGAPIKEMEILGVRCHFSEDGRTLDV